MTVDDQETKTNTMKQKNDTKDERGKALLALVREMGIEMGEAVRFLRIAQREGGGCLSRTERYIALGKEEMKKRRKTITFEKAVQLALNDRKEHRKRTLSDLRYIARRFMRKCPELAKRRIRTIRVEECTEWIERAFDTPSQRKKARAALSGIFSSAIRHGWCAENPVRLVLVPDVKEKRISILTTEESERLLSAAENYEGGICLSAVAMMLYAGVRPHEVARLTWEQVHMPQGVIHILPEHSKTGGARHVTISPVLAHVLEPVRKVSSPDSLICPPTWIKHWTRLHRIAGWTPQDGKPWRPDVLRHTFATNHLKEHHDYRALQYEMGHRSVELLRTRYIAM